MAFPLWRIAVRGIACALLAAGICLDSQHAQALTSIITTVAGNGNFGNSGNGDLAIKANFSFPIRVTFDGNGVL
ncbi:hypothetical protein ABTN09_20550, partial [Acinetobacter baumannii]